MPRQVKEVAHYRDFRLSITQALGDQLASALADLTPAPLTAEALDELDERPGVYQLYRNGQFVYVGKAEKSLPTRIHKHLRKISGRRNISLSEITFTCLYVAEDFSALAPEKLLITQYKGRGEIPWNNNGFGNNDPGKRRDETVVKANHFDNLHPIDVDRVLTTLPQGPVALNKLLPLAAKEIPYTFRYLKKGYGNAYKAIVEVPETPTISQLFELIAAALPEEWQISLLPGRAIMYDDSPRTYPSVWRYYRGTQILDVEPEIEEAGEILEEEEHDEETEG
ncbi:Eco29kI family restriction endonuclease [Streptomyces albogriseolus]|uniref:Eco29kI family restriction endonuclease n=1 Tax=Streptomyces albogriseolus TaxID=1887 RepID=UPI003460AD1E|nr:Eco29kI family restriction endonuclease [Streptomyces sp. DH17]